MTNFSDIYNRAMFRFSDYTYLDIEPEKRDEIMQIYLMSAISDFKNSCAIDLTDYDTTNQRFNNDLDDEIQEILALGVAYYWLNNKTLNSELLRNIMYRGDFKAYSPANLLKEMSSLRTILRKEFRGKVNEYSYLNSNIKTLKAGD